MSQLPEEVKKGEETLPEISLYQIYGKAKEQKQKHSYLPFIYLFCSSLLSLGILYISFKASSHNDRLKSHLLLSVGLIILVFSIVYCLKYTIRILLPNTRFFRILEEIPEF